MKGKRRSPAELTRDRRRIADLYLQGYLQAEIAAELRLGQATISRDLAALHKEWLTSALLDFDQAKAQELAKIDRLEREYWTAWERSKEDAETVTERGKGTRPEGEERARPQQFERTMQRKGQVGDPRFLGGVQWCIERRCKILGIDAPERYEHGGPKGGPFPVTVVEVVRQDETL